MNKPSFSCILIVVLSLGWPSATYAKPKVEPPHVQAPESFAVELDTTKGKLVIEVYRSWAPNSADRFYNMVKSGYLDGSIFHWVVLDSLVAFGLNADPKISKAWLNPSIPADIPRRETRVGDVYMMPSIYLDAYVNVFVAIQTGNDGGDASRLGATPLGRVVEGIEILDQLDDAHMAKGSWVGYNLKKKGDKKVRKKFPQLDSVTRASVLDHTPQLPNASEIDDQFVMSEQIPPGHALLRIYRKDMINQNFNIRIDGVLVARLRPETMYQTYLPAGSHKLSGKVAFKYFRTGILDKLIRGKTEHSDDFTAGAAYHLRLSPYGANHQQVGWVRIANDYGSKDSMNLAAAEDLIDEEVSPNPSDVN